MDLARVGAELEIRRVIAEYCQLCDDGEFEALADRFTSDGSFDFAGRVSTGRPAVQAFFERSQPPALRGKHLTLNSIIEVDGDEATVRSDFVFVRIIDGVLTPTFTGRYEDGFVRAGDRWRIARRRVVLLDSAAS